MLLVALDTLGRGLLLPMLRRVLKRPARVFGVDVPSLLLLSLFAATPSCWAAVPAALIQPAAVAAAVLDSACPPPGSGTLTTGMPHMEHAAGGRCALAWQGSRNLLPRGRFSATRMTGLSRVCYSMGSE